MLTNDGRKCLENLTHSHTFTDFTNIQLICKEYKDCMHTCIQGIQGLYAYMYTKTTTTKNMQAGLTISL